MADKITHREERSTWYEKDSLRETMEKMTYVITIMTRVQLSHCNKVSVSLLFSNKVRFDSTRESFKLEDSIGKWMRNESHSV
jgi:hypothetical protein